jgi:hypothetical protein
MADNELLKEAIKIHPEAANSIEAVDLYAMDIHKAAMKADNQDKFYHLSVLYNQLRNLYQELLRTVTVVC